jgi:hypothetical protein
LPGGVEGVAYHPGGAALATAGVDGVVRLWDAATGQPRQTLAGHAAALRSGSVAFSPDGALLASGGMDRAVKVWDAATGAELLTLDDHTGPVFAVAFSPDGARLASGSRDGTVKLWEPRTGEKVLTLRGHASEVYTVAFSGDGARLVTAGRDGAVLVWDAQPDAAAAAAERAVVGLLDALFAKPLSRADIAAWVRESPALGEAARDLALRLAADGPEETDPERYYAAARAVLIRPRLNPAAYRLARLQVVTAARLAPLRGAFHIAVAVADYRLGRYAEALATLERLERLHPGIPAAAAVAALAHQRLGQPELARVCLSRAKAVAAEPRWADRADADDIRALIREADALLAEPSP